MNRVARGHRTHERGYVLLILLLSMALLVIAAAVAAPSLAFQVKRDREEELIHRGVQYSRAIRNFASKTGRFPLKLEDLQETGGVRYIRKLYKDPVTGGDFKLLHMTDMPSITGLSNLNPASQGDATAVNRSIPRPDPVSPPPGKATTDPQENPADTSNPDQSSAPSSGAQATAGAQPSGGVILGVASKSKDKTIREFNHKNHYNDWLFFYYPPYGGNQLTGPTSLIPSNAPVQGVAVSPSQSQSQGESAPQSEGVPVQQ